MQTRWSVNPRFREPGQARFRLQVRDDNGQWLDVDAYTTCANNPELYDWEHEACAQRLVEARRCKPILALLTASNQLELAARAHPLLSAIYHGVAVQCRAQAFRLARAHRNQAA
jgi:hypothetical protein